jgi:competence ComEA-like helix-hairpin-helix protein
MRFLALALFVVSVHAQDLPDGKGRELVETVCASCHSTDIIVSMRATRTGWESTVEDMFSRGASAKDAERAQIIDYLAKYLGKKVNVNKASAADLAVGLGLEPKEGEAIVQYRKDHGDFKAWADLSKVTGVDQKKLESKKDDVSF